LNLRGLEKNIGPLQAICSPPCVQLVVGHAVRQVPHPHRNPICVELSKAGNIHLLWHHSHRALVHCRSQQATQALQNLTTECTLTALAMACLVVGQLQAALCDTYVVCLLNLVAASI